MPKKTTPKVKPATAKSTVAAEELAAETKLLIEKLMSGETVKGYTLLNAEKIKVNTTVTVILPDLVIEGKVLAKYKDIK